MALIESWVRCDLNSAVQVQYLQGNLFSADNQGNLVGVRVFDGSEPASLSGTVSANVIRADNTTVPVAGSIQNGNECYVILPQAAYAVTGVVKIAIKITSSSVITTLAMIISTVYESSTDEVVDPGTIIPSIETLIAEIEAAVATIPADYSSLWATIAPAYTSLTFPVRKGQYCTNNGHMYRAKQDIATSESFTSSHWEVCNVGVELFNQIDAGNQAISDLKSALDVDKRTEKAEMDYIKNNLFDFSGNFVQGGFSRSSGVTPNDKYVTNYPGRINAFTDNKLIYNVDSGLTAKCFILEDGQSGSTNIGNVTGSGSIVVPADGELVIAVKKTDDSDMSVSDLGDTSFFVQNGYNRAIDLFGDVDGFSIMDSVEVGVQVGSNGALMDYNNQRAGTADLITFDKPMIVGVFPNNYEMSYIMYMYRRDNHNYIGTGGTWTSEERFVCTDVAYRFVLKKGNNVAFNEKDIDCLYTRDTDSDIKRNQYSYNKYENGHNLMATIPFRYLHFTAPVDYTRDYDTGVISVDKAANYYDSNKYYYYHARTLGFPEGMEPGGTYLAELYSGDTSVRFKIDSYDENAQSTNIVDIAAGTLLEFTIPSNSTGLNIMLMFPPQYAHQSSYYPVITKKSSPTNAYLKAEIDKINGSVGYATDFHTQEDSIVDRVLNDADKDTIVIGVITDTHNHGDNDKRTAKQAKALAELSEKVSAFFDVHLGDASHGYYTTRAENQYYLVELWEAFAGGSVPKMYAIGHHEMFGSGSDPYQQPSSVTHTNCIGMCGRSNKYIDGHYSVSGADWYVDKNGIRLIGLDSVNNTAYGFSNDTVSFLQSTLTGCTLPVIVFTHIPIDTRAFNNTTGQQGVDIKNKQAILSLLNGYEPGVIAYIHGHTHNDNYVELEGINFPLIGVCCSLPSKVDTDKLPAYGNPASWNRTLGTYSEYCFDILNIHPDTGTLKFFRFGAGEDRTFPQT